MKRILNALATLFTVAACATSAIAQDVVECRSPETDEFSFRIVNGRTAEAAKWPFIAKVLVSSSQGTGLCGGSFIAPQWVLSAAHCYEPGDDVTVYPVAANGESSATGIRVTQAFPHPDYTYRSGAGVNDVLLLKLQRPYDMPLSQLAIIPTANTAERLASVRTCAEVAGWGTVSSGGRTSPTLRAVNVKVMSDAVCSGAYGSGIGHREHLCAGYEQGGKDSCQGDSGGPLIIRDGPTGHLLIGVVSFGRGCAEPGYPGVYARASSYRDWIFKTVELNP